MVLIRDNYNPEGRLVPYRNYNNIIGKCTTRQMTDEERAVYGVVSKEIEPSVEEPPKKKKRNITKPKKRPPKDYEFGARLRAERERLGVGTPTFSRMIGIPKSTIEAVERCQYGLRQATKEKICKALGWECE